MLFLPLQMTQLYDAGNPMAPLLLANWYEQGDGDGVVKNEKEAVAWYMRAAEMGNFFAIERLRRAFSVGELGLSKDTAMVNEFENKFNSQLP